MGNLIRAFIAIDITQEIRDEVTRLQSLLKDKINGNITWVKPENIHLTLRFLGQISDKKLEEIKNITKKVANKVKQFNLELGVVGAFPDISHPRVIWVGINHGFNQLTEISALLEDSLESINFSVGEKYFHPHLTIARIRSIDKQENLSEITKDIKPNQLSELVEKIYIYQSELTKEGAKYTKLFETKLPK